MAIDFGSDYSTFTSNGSNGMYSFGLSYRRIFGPRVPLEGVARVWLQSLGDLSWAPNLGGGLAALVNGHLNTAELRRLQTRLATQARLVDFVVGADVAATYTLNSSLAIGGQIVLADFTRHPLLVDASAAAVLFSFPTL